MFRIMAGRSTMDDIKKRPVILGGTRRAFFTDRNGNPICVSRKLQEALQHLNAREV